MTLQNIANISNLIKSKRTERHHRQAHYRDTSAIWQELWANAKLSDTKSCEANTHMDTPPIPNPSQGPSMDTTNLKLLFNAELEELSNSNYSEWMAALTDACTISDATWIINPATLPPSYMDDTTQRKVTAAVRSIIRRSIPDNIRAELPVGCLGLSPTDIITAIRALYMDDTDAIHRRQELEAQNLRLKPGQSISEYIGLHRSLRRRMHQSAYPRIADETTSVRFMVNGLDGNPKFRDAARAIRLTGIPSSLKLMEDRLLEEEAASGGPQAFTLHPTNPQHGASHSTAGRGRGNKWRGRNDGLKKQIKRELMNEIRTESQKDETAKTKHKAARKPRATVAHAKASDVPGTLFFLDSAATPSFINQPVPESQPTSVNTNIVTADGTTQATQKFATRLHLPLGAKLDVDALYTPRFKNNLLSVSDYVREASPLVFTKKGVYEISDRLFKILNLTKKIATCKNGMYCTRARVTKQPDHIASPLDNPTNNTVGTAALQSRTSPYVSNIKRQSTQDSLSVQPIRPVHAQSPKILNRGSHSSVSPTTMTPHFTLTEPQRLPTDPPSQRMQLLQKWHLALNHANSDAIRSTLRQHKHPDASKLSTAKLTCSSCFTGKMHRAPHRRVEHKCDRGDILSTDVVGPLDHIGINGERYFVTFTDLASRYTFVVCVQRKSAVLDAITHAIKYTADATGRPPRIIHSDNAKEYLSQAVQAAASAAGVRTQSTIPYNPEENGVAERINRTIMNGVRCVLQTAKIDKAYWPFAICDIAFKHSLLTHSTTGISPYSVWHDTQIQMPTLYAFGQLGYMPHQPQKGKLSDHGQICRYLSMTSLKHGLVEHNNGAIRRIRLTDFHPVYPTNDPVQNTPAAFVSFKKRLAVTPSTITPDTTAPLNLAHALKFPDRLAWQQAHDLAIRKLENERVIDWNVNVPDDARPIPLTMAYQYKRSPDGSVSDRKARCAVRGDLMKEHIHFDPSAVQCPTTEKATARLLIAIATSHAWPMEHMDIRNAFVQEPSQYSKPIYVKGTPYSNGQYPHAKRIGLLKRNLWGGKSAGHYYINGLFAYMRSANFSASTVDTCLLYRNDSKGRILVAVTVDDFLVIATAQSLIDDFYDFLTRKYTVKRLGRPTLFLGWTIHTHDNGDVTISQPALVRTTIANADMSSANGKLTPYTYQNDLHAPCPDDTHMPHTIDKFRQIVGDMRYLADSTRPDLAFITTKLGAAMHAPTARHWAALKAAIRYLIHTVHTGITYRAQLKRAPQTRFLRAFSDASFASDNLDRKSMTGMVLCYNASPVAWSAKKQSIIALSTTEAEYVAMASALQMLETSRRMLIEVGVQAKGTSSLNTDNQATVQMVSQMHGTKRRKFIDLRHHYIRDIIQQNDIRVYHVPAEAQFADMFTKSLRRLAFSRQCQNLNVGSVAQ